jgi:signal transduction histidine kinase
MASVIVYFFLSFASNAISKSLMKNLYPAGSIMKDDYAKIDSEPIVQNGGGVQVVNDEYEVVYSAGINTLGTERFTIAQFTDFLTFSKSKGVPYSYDILYNENGRFWLIVTFPTSLRLDISVAYNDETVSKDLKNVAGIFIAAFAVYLLMLAVSAFIFSKITAVRITNPLRKLCESAERLREGDYSARVDLNLKNEFAQLQDTFNDMAARIETEIAMRKRSEDSRKQLILDISHDLKNPLASISGYTELCRKVAAGSDEKLAGYLDIISKNSQRANRLLSGLFELSRLDSPDFSLRMEKTDICEFLRQTCGEILPALEQAGFIYDFDIPENQVFVMTDTVQMSRVLHNLADNALRYNPAGTVVSVSLDEKPASVAITFSDDGRGIPAEVSKDIFKPFVRADSSRNSETGGSGLGLSIADKIVKAHGGKIELDTNKDKGTAFIITLQKC